MQRTDYNNLVALNADKITIEIKDESNTTISEISGEKEILLIYTQKYKKGDKICFTKLSVSNYLVINIDDELSEALIYVPGNKLEFSIPFGDDSIPYSLSAFKGSMHTINMHIAKEEEIYCYRNLAKNVMDQRGGNNILSSCNCKC